jgi:hypothetical protein
MGQYELGICGTKIGAADDHAYIILKACRGLAFEAFSDTTAEREHIQGMKNSVKSAHWYYLLGNFGSKRDSRQAI